MGAAGLYVEGLVSEGTVARAIPPQSVALAFETLEHLVNAVDAPGYVGYSRTLLAQLTRYPGILLSRLEEVHDSGTYVVQNELPVGVLTGF